MLITSPTPFAEAITIAQRKQLLPTDLSSAELRQLEAELKRRSIFSARLSLADPLQQIQDDITQIVSGEKGEDGVLRSIPEAKLRLKRALEWGVDSLLGNTVEATGNLKTAPASERNELVQWCHGSPGLLFLEAALEDMHRGGDSGGDDGRRWRVDNLGRKRTNNNSKKEKKRRKERSMTKTVRSPGAAPK